MNILTKLLQKLLVFGLLTGLGACQSSRPPIHQYTWLAALERSLIQAKRNNEQALEMLKKDVKKNGNSREGLERIKRAELIRKRSTNMQGELDKLKAQLVKEAGQGHDPKTRLPKRPLNKSIVKRIMRDKVPLLSKKLNDYTQFISQEFKDLELPKFELLGKGYEDQNFYETYFQNVNLVEALLSLSQKQSVVLSYETEVLKKLGAGDLTVTLKFDGGSRFRFTDTQKGRYARFYSNQFYKTRQNPLSTFSIDVDHASYSNVRRYLKYGNRPPKAAVRVEEMINYFDYNYPKPERQKDGRLHPFSINTEYGICPWNTDHQLLHIGLQGAQLKIKNQPPSNLVFLIDVSGSMGDENKLPLLKRSFKILLNQLTNTRNKVAIVVYAGAAGLVLPPTYMSQKNKIIAALDSLYSGGSTAGGEGIQLAYKIAQQAFIPGGNNRVILATDGDFNVGLESDEALVQLIKQKSQTGVYLTCLGFGTGNYNDSMMEKITNAGNGNYFYIDQLNEAKKVLAQSLAGTLFTIAKDVKIQLEFNPAYVKAYRLVGYENRLLKHKDFKNDKVDAGELGAGHTVTALYEIIPAKVSEATGRSDIPLKYQKPLALDSLANHNNELATVKLRYKTPVATTSQLMEQVVENQMQPTTSHNFRFSAAVAAFGMHLRNSSYIGKTTYAQIEQWAVASLGKDSQGYRKEFVTLVKQTQGQ